jgi:hypothetical protein
MAKDEKKIEARPGLLHPGLPANLKVGAGKSCLPLYGMSGYLIIVFEYLRIFS